MLHGNRVILFWFFPTSQMGHHTSHVPGVFSVQGVKHSLHRFDLCQHIYWNQHYSGYIHLGVLC